MRNDIFSGCEFFGYKKYSKKWTVNDEDLKEFSTILSDHIDDIGNDLPVYYPSPSSFKYPKYSLVSKQNVEDFDYSDITSFKFDLDDMFDEINSAENLLLNSQSGHELFKVELALEIPRFKDDFSSDKIPGHILDHRYSKENELELLMKWKYFSQEESTWVKYENFKNYFFVKSYYLKQINQKE